MRPSSILPLFTVEIMGSTSEHKSSRVQYHTDFSSTAVQCMERAYLLRFNGQVVERPQHMFMRVAVAVHGRNIDSALESYHMMSMMYFIHGPAVLISAGSPRSTFNTGFSWPLVTSRIGDILGSVRNCAMINSNAADIGLNVSEVPVPG